jgi:tetratricopeptide (TPR) repeat protein
MSKFRLAHLGLAMAALGFTAAAPLVGLSSAAYAAETVRAEIGGPLQEAQKLMKAGKNREAVAELRRLDSVGGKTPNEMFLIERVRASAASSAGDMDTAAKAFEALIASGKLGASEKDKFQEGLVGIYMRARDFGKANAVITRVLNDHYDPKLHAYLVQNYYSMGNFSAATKELQTELRADEKNGRAPSEEQLQMLANLQLRSGDKAGYVTAIEKLATYYPKVNYWTDLLNRVSGKPGFSERLSVDVWRLKLANNLIKKPSEYMEMSQLVLQAAAPGEAVKVIDKAYKAGAFGVGADAPRHQRLKDLADKTLADNAKTEAATEANLVKAKDNDGLVALGYSLVQAGQTDKGLKMMEEAIKANGLKHADDAKLHLGVAYSVAGKKQQAISTLKSVGGTDGTADLARYWIMAINHPSA